MKTVGPTCGRTTLTPLAGWLLVFLVSLAVYAATANRGPQWQGSGCFIREITTGRWINPLGLAPGSRPTPP